MREIVFRGKRADNGEWIVGSLLHVRVIPQGGCCLIFGPNFGWDDLGELHAKTHAIIDPETVGQYTGQRDKNNRMIFEGDILEFVEESGAVYHDEVVWNDMMSGFRHRTKDGHTLTLFDEIAYKSSVIGNIHDNPELLGGGA